MREDIISYCQNLSEPSWPPTINELTLDEPPSSLLLFQRQLLGVTSTKKKIPDSVARSIGSISSDIINAVSRGKTMTLKHYLLALGIHNMTVQRHVVDILNHLGHCLDYNTTCQIESAEALKSQLIADTC